ncbi:MAG: aminotransferase class IV, partial [Anaerolineales bacterium]|nr:aminotransferase class IV [Anaerolineales bacterium]
VFPITRRDSPQSLDPKVKHISRLNLVMAELEAKQVDPRAQAVMLDLDGNISETVGGNIFVVTNGVIKYPSSRNLLEGVSRETIVEMAKSLGIPTKECVLQPYEVYTADEVFLTTTSFCIMPVSKINGNPLAAKVPGSITKQLTASWSELVGMDIVQQAQSHLKI